MPWKVPQNVVSLGEAAERDVLDCVRGGWITEGPVAARFLEMIREITGAPYAVLAPNGTLALYLALRAAGVGQGDEVVVPDLTFIASATAVMMTGATPIFADVDEHGLVTDGTLLSAIGAWARPKAIMPVHLFGFHAKLSPQWLDWRTQFVVADACQAFGPPSTSEAFDVPSAPTPTQAFSFFADKAFTTGEGGAVVTADAELYERMRLIRNQGRIDRGTFSHPAVGVNLRMTDVQCAIGVNQLKQFSRIRLARQQVWSVYAGALAPYDFVRIVAPPLGRQSQFIPFRVVVRFEQPIAQRVCAIMRERGIVEPREMFRPLHLQPCFAHLRHKYDPEQFVGSIALWKHAMLLPCWPAMFGEDVSLVVEELTTAYRLASAFMTPTRPPAVLVDASNAADVGGGSE